MAKTMNQAETAAFLARRPPEGQEPVVAKRGSNRSPDGKPQRANGKTPVTMAHLKHLITRIADYTKAITDPLERRIAVLESGSSGEEKLSLAHHGQDGNVRAELRRDGNRVFLRMGDISVTAEAGTERAAELLAKFDSVGRELLQ